MACRRFRVITWINGVNCTLRNKLQENLAQSTIVFIEEHTFGNIFYKLSSIWFRKYLSILKLQRLDILHLVIDKQLHSTFYNGCNHLFVLGLKLIHITRRASQATAACGISHAITLQWRHNESDGVSNHRPHDCLLNRLFRSRSKKTSNLRVTGLCAVNSPRTGEFPA